MSKTFQACTAAAILVCVLGVQVRAESNDRSTESDMADPREACADLPSYQTVLAALKSANSEPGGLNLAGSGQRNNMWATVVNRDGVVCGVVTTGTDRGDQWPGGRLISAQRANTANAFSLPKFAFSTANLYAAVQPGGAMFGIEQSNPVAPGVAYRGDPARYGTSDDPIIGRRVGGINVTGGGVALYESAGLKRLVGAIGVSGDTACRDHRVAWVMRTALRLDGVPAGVNSGNPTTAPLPDNIVYDMGAGTPVPSTEGSRPLSASGFGHPLCSIDELVLAGNLPAAPASVTSAGAGSAVPAASTPSTVAAVAAAASAVASK